MKPDIWIREECQVPALWFLAVVIAILIVALAQLDPPGGWLPLEFPAVTDAASSIESWSGTERDAVMFALGIDYLFLIVYPLFLSLLCGRAANHWNLPAGLARWSVISSRLVLLAAPLDALENSGLYFLIGGEMSNTLQWFITGFAAMKWLIVLIAIAVALVCIGFRKQRQAPGTDVT